VSEVFRLTGGPLAGACVCVVHECRGARPGRSVCVFGALASALGVLLILNVLNPDGFIVRVNAGRVAAANPFDAGYAMGLSADAVPTLIAALPAMNQQDECVTAARILDRWSPPQHFDVLTGNLDRSLAWQAVNANRSYLQNVACSVGRD
jgi:hypothetical protein